MDSIIEYFRDLSINVIAIVIATIILSSSVILFFWSSLKSFLVSIISSLNSTVNIPFYLTVVIFLIGISVPICISYLLKYFKKSYRDYKFAEFYGIKWSWSYRGDGRIRIDSLTPVCPECNSKMSWLNSRPNKGEVLIFCKNDDCKYGLMKENADYITINTYRDIREHMRIKIDKFLRDKGLRL